MLIVRKENPMFRKLLSVVLTLSFLASCSPAIEFRAAATASVTITPTSNATDTPVPTPTPDAMDLAFDLLQGEGINVSHEDGVWQLKIGELDVPGAFFDEDGTALHILLGDKQIDIPVDAAGERLELNADGVLLLYDETGLVIAVFDPANSGKGWEIQKTEYPVCAPENFKDCRFSSWEELFSVGYFQWLEREAKN
jgi:hypothetical protein